jgi:phosphoserine phosphatase
MKFKRMLSRGQSSAIRILLIRHGETEFNRNHRFQGRIDVPLNPEGVDQAQALARALKNERLAAIYSSPLRRAVETARLVKSFHPSTPFFEEPGLIEMDLGEFDGIEGERWAEHYPDFRKRWLESPAALRMPGGESLQDVQNRVVETLERIALNYSPEDTLLISSHSFVNRTILCHALGKPLDSFRELRQGNAALNILYKEGREIRVEVINDQSHLKKGKDI